MINVLKGAYAQLFHTSAETVPGIAPKEGCPDNCAVFSVAIFI